jgi:hypothetical protein
VFGFVSILVLEQRRFCGGRRRKMIDYKNAENAVTVFYAGKALSFRHDQLPADWETLFRDPEVEECVNEVVIQKGQPLAEGQGDSRTDAWNDVSACLDELRGSTG